VSVLELEESVERNWQTRRSKAVASPAAPSHGMMLQRKCACGQSTASGAECEECKKKELQRKAAGTAKAETAPPIVHEVLNSPGQALDHEARNFFEPRFGYDFSKVRVHTDATAAESARAVNAVAYTVGRNVVFASGQYAPDTEPGRALLAHELTHVRQQGSSQEPGHIPIGREQDSQEDAARAAELTVHAPQVSEWSSAASSPILQRKNGGDVKDVDVDKMAWPDAVDLAKKNAKDAKTKGVAENIYKKLVVRAAQKITVSKPLVDRKPSLSDIIWDWKDKGEYSAFVDPKKIDKAPDDYWKWISFKPSSIHKDEAFTVSISFHEMDHAVHGKVLYDQYKKASPKPAKGWEDFYLDHFAQWTEPAIQVKESGMAGLLAGLPEKIQPSGIEFRAYVNQFLNFFHKVGLDEQGYLARTVVLFYPLKLPSPKEKISDPGLDVAKSRQQLLEYFKAPPVDKTKVATIQARVATELKSALILFRPDADQTQMKKDFKEILDFAVDPDTRTKARKAYKPEPL
jgi:hypothetical protein